MNTMTSRSIVGVIGNIISFVLFVSPMPTFVRIVKNKSIDEEFIPDANLACVMNCLLWIFYGLPTNHPNYTIFSTINGIGLVMEFIYLTIFLIYGNKKHRDRIGFVLLIEIIVIVVIAFFNFQFSHAHTHRSTLVGVFCVVFGIVMSGSPMTIILKAIKTKSVELMPLYPSLTGFLSGICWTTYALLKFDINILLAYGTWALLGFLQLILYRCYYSTTPKNIKMRLGKVLANYFVEYRAKVKNM